MLVSHRHRFIYAKTVKTAGTSVESYFEPYCMPENEWFFSHARQEHESASGIVGYRGRDLPNGLRWWHHMSAQEILDRVGTEIWSSYFKFCVVRNPFEKVASYFYFARATGTLKTGGEDSDSAQFESWLSTSQPPIDRQIYTIDHRLCMDYIVRYETLEADLSSVCEKIGIPWDRARLPTLKAGFRPSSGRVGQLYTEKSRQIVRAAYEYELATFGYEFPRT